MERIAPEPGERVLLVALPGTADALVAPLRAALSAAGAVDLGALAASGQAPAGWGTPFTASLRPDDLARGLADVDVGVMLPGAIPAHAPYAVLQRALAAADAGRKRTIHFHWAGAYALDGTLKDVGPAEAAVYQRALIETDYTRLAAVQRAFEAAMRTDTVRVTTPDGTDLRFHIGGRPVTKQDGDGRAARARQARNLIDREVELPAGAIRVAPIEESVHGSIAFPPGDWAGERVEGLVMRFERGRLVSFDARVGRAAVERELQAAGPAGHAFRELALGFNPLLAIPATGERWVPYYGYGAGVVRLSLGDNTELGGNVSGGYVRWNFFPNASVTVGRQVWVRDGQLQPR